LAFGAGRAAGAFEVAVQGRINRNPTAFPYFQIPKEPAVNGTHLDDVLEAKLAELKRRLEESGGGNGD
jgi:hypothetical protein